jgi:hypothetical protein
MSLIFLFLCKMVESKIESCCKGVYADESNNELYLVFDVKSDAALRKVHMFRNDSPFNSRTEAEFSDMQQPRTFGNTYRQTSFLPITSFKDEDMPYLTVKWDNEDNDVAFSGMFEVNVNNVVEHNKAGKSKLPMLDFDCITKDRLASPVFYCDDSAEQSIENTNPASYMQQDGLFAANPNIVQPNEAPHHSNAVYDAKSRRDNLKNNNSDASSIYGLNKNDGNIKGAAILGSNVKSNNTATKKKQETENIGLEDSDEQDNESFETESDNGVGEITLFGTFCTGFIFFCLM